ncbi:MAG: hypothetical protein K2X66_06220, partial [Cyanobacteria bacterium]|nr:hypothetical protein [Cyanobacteriota bacterium]
MTNILLNHPKTPHHSFKHGLSRQEHKLTRLPLPQGTDSFIRFGASSPVPAEAVQTEVQPGTDDTNRIKTFKIAMATGNPAIQKAAALSMGLFPLGHANAFNELKACYEIAFQTNIPEVQAAATAIMINSMHEKNAKEVFNKAWNTQHPMVQEAAIKNLDCLPEACRKEAYELAIQSPHENVQLQAISKLYWLPSSDRENAYELAIQSSHQSVQLEAVSKMTELPNSVLEKAFDEAMKGSPAIRLNALSSFHVKPIDQRKEILEKALGADLKNVDPLIQDAVIPLLGYLSASDQKELVSKIWKDGDLSIKIHLIPNMSELDPSSVETLVEEAWNAQDPILQTKIVNLFTYLPEKIHLALFDKACKSKFPSVQAAAMSQIKYVPVETRGTYFELALNSGVKERQIAALMVLHELPEQIKMIYFNQAMTIQDTDIQCTALQIADTISGDKKPLIDIAWATGNEKVQAKSLKLLIYLSESERQAFFDKAWATGNPVIQEAAAACIAFLPEKNNANPQPMIPSPIAPPKESLFSQYNFSKLAEKIPSKEIAPYIIEKIPNYPPKGYLSSDHYNFSKEMIQAPPPYLYQKKIIPHDKTVLQNKITTQEIISQGPPLAKMTNIDQVSPGERFEIFIEAIKSKDPSVQKLAVQKFQTIPPEKRLVAFCLIWSTKNKTLQEEALKKIYTLPLYHRIIPFKLALASKDPRILDAAILMIQLFTPSELAKVYAPLLKLDNTLFQVGVVSSLGSLRYSERKKAFEGTLKHPKPEVQVAGVSQIHTFQNVERFEMYQKAWETHNPLVQAAAISQLQHMD